MKRPGRRQAARDRDRALAAFVAESGDALFRIAVLLTSDRRRAEDVNQETLQRLAASWSLVKSTTSRAMARLRAAPALAALLTTTDTCP